MTSPSAADARRNPFKAILIAAALVAGALSMVFLTRSEGTPQRERREPLVPVKVAVAALKAVPVEIRAVGTVEAYATVSIKSRVDGQLVGVHFREGQDVKKGELLFTIDPRPYEAALKEAQARLERDIALMDKAERDARRYAELVAKNFVSSDKYEQFRANFESLRATADADRATVERARLQLEYCFIRSPLAGRTGRLLVDEGTQIKANDDKAGMVDVAQVMPIYVGFAVPQQNLSAIKTHMARGELRVAADIPESGLPPEEGTLSFLDNKVNSQTGTVLLKGSFANTSRHLWPGQFVTATLTLDDPARRGRDPGRRGAGRPDGAVRLRGQAGHDGRVPRGRPGAGRRRQRGDRQGPGGRRNRRDRGPAAAGARDQSAGAGLLKPAALRQPQPALTQNRP